MRKMLDALIPSGVCDFCHSNIKRRSCTTAVVIFVLVIVSTMRPIWFQMLVVSCAMITSFEIAIIRYRNNSETDLCANDNNSSVKLKCALTALIFGGTWASSMSLLYMSSHSMKIVWILICGVAASDTAGYVAGTYYGGPKIIPSISPNKTISGTVASFFSCFLTILIAERLFIPHANRVGFFGYVLTSCLAIFGDLLESAFKRAYGKKDAGKIFPGHGGVLDRVDSLMWSSIFWAIMHK